MPVRDFTRLGAAAAAAAAAAALGCGPLTDVEPEPTKPSLSISADPGVQLASYMDRANIALSDRGAGYRVAIAEYVSTGSDGRLGGTVLAKFVGNKRLGEDFVPGDPLRAAQGTGRPEDITYVVDRTADAAPPQGGLTAAAADAAIERAMRTWDAVSCSKVGLVRNPDYGLDVGVLAYLLGGGGGPFILADVQHAGWGDLDFAGSTLAATFTFVFIDAAGNPLDRNHDGRADVSFREIYYDPTWTWADDGIANVDVESVALHEMGHGLSQDHFGKVWLKNDGSLAASPRAVMNAAYASPLRTLTGTDEAGHCGSWAGWPVH